MVQKALEIKNLKKVYDAKVHALTGIDLEVEKGDFFALLGPNGAGKSTTIGIITSLVNKTSGLVKVFGDDIDVNVEAAKAHIGLVPQEFNFNIFEKVLDIIVSQAGFYGIPKKEAVPRAEKYLKQLGLWEKRNTQARMLSGGMKRRLMIVRALVHEPKLLILDEPSAGVDIETRRDMWEFLVALNKDGLTIILTTHYLEEAENLSNKIAIIDNGSLILFSSKKNLLSKLAKETYIFDVVKAPTKLPPLADYKLILVDEHRIEVEIAKEQNINDVFEYFKTNRITVLSMGRKTNRLEELFIELTGNGGKTK